jgi:nucleotide-binding universal stress UspA family protein
MAASTCERRPAGATSATRSPTTYTRLVVPVDGSPAAEAILPFVLEIAGPLDLEVVLLGVAEWRPPPASGRGPCVPGDDVEAAMATVEKHLSALARRLRQHGARARTLVRYGDPVREILAGADAVKADLIAMTAHGRTGVGRVLFGSVAEGVLRRAEIPVLLARPTPAGVWPAAAAHI